MKKELDYSKQLMHNAIAQRSPTDAQPVPEQWPQATFLPILYIKHDYKVWNILLASLGWLFWLRLLPASFALQPAPWQGDKRT